MLDTGCWTWVLDTGCWIGDAGFIKNEKARQVLTDLVIDWLAVSISRAAESLRSLRENALMKHYSFLIAHQDSRPSHADFVRRFHQNHSWQEHRLHALRR